MEVKDIEIEKIKTLDNIRMREIEKDISPLMSTLNANGLLQPIGISGKENGYIIVWGNRRFIAAKKLGWKKIPAVILDTTEMSEEDYLIHNAIENIHRKEITVLELGKTVSALKKFNYSLFEIAIKLGINKDKVLLADKVFNHIPAEFREVTKFYNSPVSKQNAGNISATVANEIISLRHCLKLSSESVKKLFEYSKGNFSSYAKLKIIGSFLKSGYSIDEALKKCSMFRAYRINIVCNLEEYSKIKAVSFKDFVIDVITEKYPNLLLKNKSKRGNKNE